jgi:hypothetical protein
MKKKIRKKTENYGHGNLPILVDSEPGMQPRFKLCTQPKPTSFTDKLPTGNFCNCEMTEEGRAKLTHYWIIYAFILNFIINFVRRSVRLDADFDVSLNFVKF